MPATSDKTIGYALYLAGCSGRVARQGFKLDKVFSENEVLAAVSAVVAFFKANAQPRQRLVLLVDKIGREEFLSRIGLKDARSA